MRVWKVKVISLPYIFQVLYVLCFTRPRYQVSVYRTIGPLVGDVYFHVFFFFFFFCLLFVCFDFFCVFFVVVLYCIF